MSQLSNHPAFGGYQWQNRCSGTLGIEELEGYWWPQGWNYRALAHETGCGGCKVTEITGDNLTPGHCCCGFLLLPLPPLQGGEAASLRALLLTEQLLQLAGPPETCHCCSPRHRGSGLLAGAGRTSQLSGWSMPASPLTGKRWSRIGCQRAACGLKVVAYDWSPPPKTQHLLH